MRPASLTIRNIPAPVLARLRERAARHRRSMQGEILSMLEIAAAGPAAPMGAGDLLRQVRSWGVSTPAESVQMIREDRDGRQRR